MHEAIYFRIWTRTWISGAAMKAFFGKTRIPLNSLPPNSLMLLLRRCAHGTKGFCFIGAWQTSHCVVSLDAVVHPINWISSIRRKYDQVMFLRSDSLVSLLIWCSTINDIISCYKQWFGNGYQTFCPFRTLWARKMSTPYWYLMMCFMMLCNGMHIMLCRYVSSYNGLYWNGSFNDARVLQTLPVIMN